MTDLNVMKHAVFDLSRIRFDPNIQGTIDLSLYKTEEEEDDGMDGFGDAITEAATYYTLRLGEETLWDDYNAGGLDDPDDETAIAYFEAMRLKLKEVFDDDGVGYALLPGDARYAIEMELNRQSEEHKRQTEIAAGKAADEAHAQRVAADANWGRF